MFNKSPLLRALQYVFAAFITVFTLGPFLWLFISSISFQKNLTTTPLQFIPAEVTWQRYIDVFANPDNAMAYTFRIAMQNSLLVALAVTLLTLVAGSLAAYAFTRLRFRFRKSMIYLFLFTYMIPPIVIVMPLYMIIQSLGLLDLKRTLVFLYAASVTPFVTWVMQSYFAGVPKSFEEAADIDGCSRIQTLWYVVVPIVRPGLIATGIMAFLMAWDEFFMSLIFTSSLNAKTISVAIAEFSGKNAVDYGMIATGGIIASIPPLIIAILFQKYLVQGMMAGGSKE